MRRTLAMAAAALFAAILPCLAAAQPMPALPAPDEADAQVSPDDAVTSLLAAHPDVARARLALREARSRRLGAEAVLAWQLAGELGLTAAQQPVDDGFTSGISENQRYDLDLSVGRMFAPGTQLSLSLTQGVTRSVFPLSDEFGSREIVRGPNFATGITVSATQPLLRGRGRAVNLLPLTLAQASVRSEELGIVEAANQALAASLEAWIELRHARLAYAQTLRSIERTQVQLAVASAEEGAGRIAPIDVDLVRQRLAANHEAALLAWALVEQRSLQLAQTVGAPADAWNAAQPVGELPPLPIPDDIASRCALARSSSPSLATLRAQRQAAALDRTRTADALRPELDVTAGITQSGLDPNVGGAWAQLARLEARTLFAGVVFSMPLGGNDAARDEHTRAALAIERADLAIAETERALCFDVTGAGQQERVLAERMAIADYRVEIAERAVAAEQARLSQGQSTVQAGLEALEQLDTAEVERLRLDADLALARLRSAQATGVLAHALLPDDTAPPP